MKKSAILAVLTMGAAFSPALRAVTVTGSVGGAPSGVNYLNFDDLTPGNSGAMSTSGPNGPVTVNISPDGQVASGSLGGVYAAPYLSGANGAGFASQVAAGPDTTPYLTSGNSSSTGGSVKLTFGSDQQYFGLLWGSVDNYNRLDFYTAGNVLVDTVTGTDVVGSPNGDQGVNGTLYVNINTTSPFRYVVASSSSYTFEFDNVAYNPTSTTTPDGGSLTGAFAAAVGLIAAARRKLS